MDVRSMCHQVISLFYVLLLGDFAFGATRTLRKICKDSEIEILSNQGVRIEPFSKSHVELSLVDQSSVVYPRSKFQLEFDFKTKSPDGVLFYGRSREHPSELIAVILSGGDLIYKIQCPTLHADILIPTKNNTRLNDGEWHTVSYSVKFRRYGHKGHIDIDGYSNAKRYEVSCDHMTSLVMGGHSDTDHGYIHELETLPGHFDGCIRNVHIPTALRSPPKYYAVSVCD